MAEQQCSIRYQASTMTAPLRRFIVDYGDCLELLSAAEKLHLLSVLTLWQGVDTELQETTEANETYTLAEAIDDYAADLPGDVLAALKCLEGIEVGSVLDLIVAITNQLREGVYQQ